MSNRTALLLLTAGSLTLAACGAGAAAETVRPADIKAGDAMGEGACGDVSQGGEPLIVDWKPEQRGDLEIAMKEGIAVVSYSCEKIQLLPECKLDGEYGYIGMTRREQVVQLKNGDELRANLPLSGATISGEMQRGATLDIAMMIVGKKRTTWDVPSKEDLKGSCAGATHFVRGATVGAFAMGTGSDAKVRAAAEIFGFGGDAASSSSKTTQNRDGDIADCQKASPDAPSAPSQCGAPIRLVLAPIAKGPPSGPPAAAAAPPPEPSCPDGLVLSEGKCTTKATAKAYECKPGDTAECKTQCDAGSLESCGHLGARETEAGDHASGRAHLQKACDGGIGESCTRLGIGLSKGHGGSPDPAAAVAAFQKGCAAGDAMGCREVGVATRAGTAPLAKDDAKAVANFRQACDGGDARGCALLGEMTEAGTGVGKDPIRAAQLYKRACDGTDAAACVSAGRLFASGPGKNEIIAQMAFQRGCIRMQPAACAGLGRIELAKQPDAAKRHFQQACNQRDPVGCAAMKVLFGGAAVSIPPQELVNQVGAACRAGSAYDCATAGLLDAAKGMAPPAKMNLQNACTRGDTFACEVQKKVP